MYSLSLPYFKDLIPTPHTQNLLPQTKLVPLYQWQPTTRFKNTETLHGTITPLNWNDLYDLGGLHLYVATVTVSLYIKILNFNSF